MLNRSYGHMPDYVDREALTTGSRMQSQPLSERHGPDAAPLVWFVGELDEHGAIYWVCDHRHSSDLEALGCAYTAKQHYLTELKGNNTK